MSWKPAINIRTAHIYPPEFLLPISQTYVPDLARPTGTTNTRTYRFPTEGERVFRRRRLRRRRTKPRFIDMRMGGCIRDSYLPIYRNAPGFLRLLSGDPQLGGFFWMGHSDREYCGVNPRCDGASFPGW
jgi:hypothetical protein